MTSRCKSLILSLSLSLGVLSAGPGQVRASEAEAPEFAPGIYAKSADGEAGPRALVALRLLREAAADEGAIRVIAGLHAPPELAPEAAQALPDAARTGMVHALQNRVLSVIAPHLRGEGRRYLTRFDFVPGMALELDQAGIEALAAHPDVAYVYRETLSEETLATSRPQVGATTAHAAGHTGAGAVVAVIDSGVNLSHPAFSGKVVAQACYSTSTDGQPNLCPNGASSQIGGTSGQACTCPPGYAHCSALASCDHGSHVAGIAVGNGGGVVGVAPGAQLMSLMVHSLRVLPDSSVGKTIREADTISAIERVYSLRNSYNIAAVNFSATTLESASVLAQFDCDGMAPAFRTAIQTLRSGKIAFVAATGNASQHTKASLPACYTNAISVGAVNSSDTVTAYSNVSNATTTVLAPGHGIVSAAYPGTDTSTKDGTSMAAPHVAGALGVLKALRPASTVDNLITNLNASTTWVNVATYTKRRLDVPKAYATPGQPSSATVSTWFCYGYNDVNWAASSGASSYRLEGSSSSSFTSPYTLYDGPGTSTSLNVGQDTYLRVQACNGAFCSAWRSAGRADYYSYCM